MLDFDLIYLVFFYFLGAIFGSFANVIIVRLPKGESIAWPGSHCQSCKAPVRWFDNIPVLSFFILRGRCRSCGARFSARYPLVELLMASLFAAAFYFDGLSWSLLEHIIFIFGLVTVSFIDIDHMILPDKFTLPGIVLGLLGAALNPERSFMDALFGVLFGGGFLYAIAYLYAVLRKQEGMGGGDIKLLAWIGAVLGWSSIPFVVISSSLVGTVAGLLMAVRSQKGLQHAIPFGPYLVLGALLYMFFGQQISLFPLLNP